MREAVELAARGWGQVSPNPLVGAVVAQGPEVVGRGWHAEYGGDHAEIMALREAGPRAQGGTLYVTLEPCRHEGHTPPCVDAIRRAGIRRVVIASRDPHPTAGGGGEVLRAAGLDVEIGLEGSQAKRLNAPFLWFHATGAPFASLKLALSMDARLGAPGVRTAVTGPQAWEEVHRLRASYDAVLIGRGTVDVDDPLLTARGEQAPRRPPVRIVLDSELQLSLNSQLIRTIDQAPVWVVGDPDYQGFGGRAVELQAAGVDVIPVPREAGHTLKVEQIWKRLAERGVLSVLVEGGGRVASALLRSRRIQRLHAFYAPIFLGEDGVAGFPDLDPSEPGEWRAVERAAIGPDTRIVLEHRALEDVLGPL
jgi:diaminohydroxyphosphoribosylaminopyrimidine deaminase/5-amino-6-(5-phosphoribosylamino)uracil reductase